MSRSHLCDATKENRNDVGMASSFFFFSSRAERVTLEAERPCVRCRAAAVDAAGDLFLLREEIHFKDLPTFDAFWSTEIKVRCLSSAVTIFYGF